MPHVYRGAGERIYPAWLEVLPDGRTRTLHGRPGADPVEIRRAEGNRGLSDAPNDGLWVPADPQTDTAGQSDTTTHQTASSGPVATPVPPPAPASPAKSRKASSR